ncbi:uncharacterized protein PV06_11471 [Exophiala oligosperma]|uniref:Uncharacterized protein n=1 Tax=Exophiala oligosperma TaxID=215243 RepID=A0A0D2D1Z3_9EURO|nr:uncharacterized protein PV06_11471 [Exophiala oligosperma]KIW36250.1 hypothetical protein PV06_11471 [Exophiala oligosperma]
MAQALPTSSGPPGEDASSNFLSKLQQAYDKGFQDGLKCSQEAIAPPWPSFSFATSTEQGIRAMNNYAQPMASPWPLFSFATSSEHGSSSTDNYTQPTSSIWTNSGLIPHLQSQPEIELASQGIDLDAWLSLNPRAPAANIGGSELPSHSSAELPSNVHPEGHVIVPRTESETARDQGPSFKEPSSILLATYASPNIGIESPEEQYLENINVKSYSPLLDQRKELDQNEGDNLASLIEKDHDKVLNNTPCNTFPVKLP